MLRNTNRALLAENKVLVEANAALRYGAKSAEWELNTLRENNHLLQRERDKLQKECDEIRQEKEALCDSLSITASLAARRGEDADKLLAALDDVRTRLYASERANAERQQTIERLENRIPVAVAAAHSPTGVYSRDFSTDFELGMAVEEKLQKSSEWGLYGHERCTLIGTLVRLVREAIPLFDARDQGYYSSPHTREWLVEARKVVLDGDCIGGLAAFVVETLRARNT
jgi:hypothetical protein